MRFEIKVHDGRWRWQLLENTGDVFAEGGKSYPSLAHCRRALNRLLNQAAFARIIIKFGGKE